MSLCTHVRYETLNQQTAIISKLFCAESQFSGRLSLCIMKLHLASVWNTNITAAFVAALTRFSHFLQVKKCFLPSRTHQRGCFAVDSLRRKVCSHERSEVTTTVASSLLLLTMWGSCSERTNLPLRRVTGRRVRPAGRVNGERRRSLPLSSPPDWLLFKHHRLWPLTSDNPADPASWFETNSAVEMLNNSFLLET